MQNIKTGGTIVLNTDDNYYGYHKNIARKKKLNVDDKQTICTLISYQGMNNYVIDTGGCMLLADGDDEVDFCFSFWIHD